MTPSRAAQVRRRAYPHARVPPDGAQARPCVPAGPPCRDPWSRCVVRPPKKAPARPAACAVQDARASRVTSRLGFVHASAPRRASGPSACPCACVRALRNGVSVPCLWLCLCCACACCLLPVPEPVSVCLSFLCPSVRVPVSISGSLTSMRACVRACVMRASVCVRARACLCVCAPWRMVAADKPLPGKTAKAKSSTTSGAFFAESLSATRGGGQMNPGAMLQTSIKQPGPRAATIMPGSPTSRHATSRMSLRGPSDSPLPATSPRRLARQDGRSGTVVIWGDGWARSASPAKPRDGPVTP